jgi:hypothetical protein
LNTFPKFSKGPWTHLSPDGTEFASAADEFGGWGVEVEADDEAEQAVETRWLPVVADGRVVALVVHASREFLSERPDELEANAALIAAAPALFHNLLLAIHHLSTGIPVSADALRNMEAAIARAIPEGGDL